MNISKQYAWRPTENYLRLLVIGQIGCGETTVIFNLLLQPGWLYYNHLYVFGKSLHQDEYNVPRKGLDAALNKQQDSKSFQQSRGVGEYISSHCH